MDSLVIEISEKIQKQISLYTSLAKGEISWIGETELDEGVIVVRQLFLIEQDTSPDNTSLRDSAYAKFLMDYVKLGGDVINLKLWVHSHASIPVCWSAKDDKAIATHSRADYFVSIVTNWRGEILARVDIFKPLRVTINNVRVIIQPNISQEALRKARSEIKKLVHYQKPVTSVLSNYVGGHYEPVRTVGNSPE